MQSYYYLFKGLEFYFSAITPKQIEVESFGVGKTRRRAIEAALQEAVRQSMGVLVVSEITISGERVLADLAGTYSSGVVKSYKVLKCMQRRDFECQIKAVVTPWAIRNAILASGSASLIDGKNLHGNFLTMKNAILQRKKLSSYYFKRMYKVGFLPELVSIEVLPSAGKKAQILLEYKVLWDEAFRSEFIRFVKKLSRDTGGNDLCYRLRYSRYLGQVNLTSSDILVRWGYVKGCTWLSESRYIRTFDRSFAQLFRKKLSGPVEVKIFPFGFCDTIYPYENVLLMSRKRRLHRRIRFEIDPTKLRNVKELRLSLGCN